MTITKNFAVIFVGAVLALAAFASFGVASAASFTNASFDGLVETYGTPGSTKKVTLRVIVPVNERVQYIETDVISDGLSPVCTKVGGSDGLQEGTHNVDINIKLPPVTGTFDLAVDGVGRFNGTAIDCEDTTSEVVHSTDSFDDVIRVIPSTSASSGNSSSGSSDVDALAAQVAALTKLINDFLAGQLSGAGCPPVALSSVRFGDRNAAVTQLQSWLIANGYANVISYGATGFYGTQTQTAVGLFAAAHPNCK